MSNAITGINDHLYPHLENAVRRADKIRLITAFVMESGVKMLVPVLKDAAERGVRIQLLTGKYLSITEPPAIYYLYDHLGDAIDIRFYDETVRSFHPKSYIFDFGDDGEIFVDSFNLSLTALTTGVDLNFRILKSKNPEDYKRFSETFDNLFHHHSKIVTKEILREYADGWVKPGFVRQEERAAQVLDLPKPEPRGAQIEALYYLKEARTEGVSKGVVVAATGVGKTHLAAFDSLPFDRVLFIAHRYEIVKQAHDVFSTMRPGERMGYYMGDHKDPDADICFSTVQTLSRDDNLQAFPPDYFDYVIVDEFHHAAAESYLKVLDYFKPKFLLGLTATPFRMDNKDIYALCDDNVIYEISLKQSIERDLLVPFRYHAIYDATDYDQVKMSGGRYVIEDLENQLSHGIRADLIIDNYRKFAGDRTLGFCVSIKHAEYMADYFASHGVNAASVHSGEVGSPHTMDRHGAVEALENKDIEIIFAVDIFNEGVDIPSVDTVMFLRPTESYVIFLQQLGRGLRKYKDKDYLTVIDFIGNYKRAHYIPLLLAGENPWTSVPSGARRMEDYDYPEGCVVNFDFRIIDLFEEMAKRDPLPVRMRDTYFSIKGSLNRRPTRLDVYEGSDIPFREYLSDGWLRFLESIDELEQEEKSWLDTPAEKFLKEVERTRLTKAYKLPTIKAFLHDGMIRERVELEEIGGEMMKFYHDNPLHQKDLKNRSNRNWRNWGVDGFARLARDNPVKFLSRGKFFHYDEVNKIMYLDADIVPYLTQKLAHHVDDILRYRTTDFFRRRYKD